MTETATETETKSNPFCNIFDDLFLPEEKSVTAVPVDPPVMPPAHLPAGPCVPVEDTLPAAQDALPVNPQSIKTKEVIPFPVVICNGPFPGRLSSSLAIWHIVVVWHRNRFMALVTDSLHFAREGVLYVPGAKGRRTFIELPVDYREWQKCDLPPYSDLPPDQPKWQTGWLWYGVMDVRYTEAGYTAAGLGSYKNYLKEAARATILGYDFLLVRPNAVVRKSKYPQASIDLSCSDHIAQMVAILVGVLGLLTRSIEYGSDISFVRRDWLILIIEEQLAKLNALSKSRQDSFAMTEGPESQGPLLRRILDTFPFYILNHAYKGKYEPYATYLTMIEAVKFLCSNLQECREQYDCYSQSLEKESAKYGINSEVMKFADAAAAYVPDWILEMDIRAVSYGLKALSSRRHPDEAGCRADSLVNVRDAIGYRHVNKELDVPMRINPNREQRRHDFTRKYYGDDGIGGGSWGGDPNRWPTMPAAYTRPAPTNIDEIYWPEGFCPDGTEQPIETTPASVNAGVPAETNQAIETPSASVESSPPTNPHLMLTVVPPFKVRSSTKDDTSGQLAALKEMEGGVTKPLLAAPDPGVLDELYRRFPNFTEPLNKVSNQLHLCKRVDGGAPLRMQPLLLVGPPGVGKSFWAWSLAKALGATATEIDFATASAGWILAGSSSQWRDSRPGHIAEHLVMNGAFANPIIIGNEIDKASIANRYDPLGPMYTLLERNTAERFIDEFLGQDAVINAAYVNWIATANDARSIAEPLLSRFVIVNIPAPTRDELLVIAQSIYQDLLSKEPWGPTFEPSLTSDVLEILVKAAGPREMRTALLDALGRAAIEGASRIEPSHTEELYRPRRSMGF